MPLFSLSQSTAPKHQPLCLDEPTFCTFSVSCQRRRHKPERLVVDSTPGLLLLLDAIISLPVDPPSLYFDLEGIRLGRLGSISLVLLYVTPQFTTYIIDVHILGGEAFSTIH